MKKVLIKKIDYEFIKKVIGACAECKCQNEVLEKESENKEIEIVLCKDCMDLYWFHTLKKEYE